MDQAVRDFVRQRAGDHCEYCHIAQKFDFFYSFHVEHVLPLQHGGSSNVENLAWSCPFCNRYKGPNLTGIDPDTGAVTRLYHPRNDAWDRHFLIEHGIVSGLTPEGRTTVSLLRMNDPLRVALRREISEDT